MKKLRYELQHLRRIGIRKLRTALQGPPTHPDFIRAAHYFSDGWPLSMWQMIDPRKIVAELRAIQQDGFNTIILVIPWRGFQTNQLEPAYDDFHVRQLNRVMAAADRLNLSVIVRMGYSHQISAESDSNAVVHTQRLLVDERTQRAWLDYLGYIYRICHSYRCFRQGFLSWEEFWHALAYWQVRDLSERRALAETSGYRQYLEARGIEATTEIPQPNDDSHRFFHAFVNYRIRQFYEAALTAFPGLSMEFRVDKERLLLGDTVHWETNDDYADLPGLRFSYWAPFMGAENAGEELDAGQAAHLLEYMLDEVSCRGSHPSHVVDQFNFVDDAPGFKGFHAEISQDQVADFLQLAAPLLLEKSRGYGVWAYRDYRQNIVFNARFLMGMKGWEVSRGRSRPLRRGGLRLGANAILRQFLPPVVAGLQRKVGFTHLNLRVVLHRLPVGAGLQARINDGPWVTLVLVAGEKSLVGSIAVEVDRVFRQGVKLELKTEGAALAIYTVSLYHHVFRGGLCREDGSPSIHHKALLAFNEALARSESTEATDQTG